MADEPVVAPDYRALCDARGWPPIAGGSPEADTETPEQDTPAETPDAASTETPAAVTDKSPDTNWEQRYNDLRPEFDRKNEVLAALEGRHGPEAQAQALAQFGVELEEDQDELDDPFEDEYNDPRDKQIEDLIAWKEEQENERFGRLEKEYIDTTLGKLEKDANPPVELSAKEKKFVENSALAARLADGRPDLEGALADFLDVQGAARDRYRESKRNTATAPVGTAGEEKLNLSDDETRQKFMTEVFEAEGGFDENP